MALMASKTAWDTFAMFSGNVVSMAGAFFFFVILGRKLSLEDIGYFSALFSILLIVSDVADFGIGSSLSRFLPPLAKDKVRLLTFLKTAFTIQLVLSLVVSLVLMVFSPIISMRLFHTGSFAGLIVVVAAGTGGAIMVNFSLFTLMARVRFWSASAFSAVNGVIRFGTVGLLLLLGSLDLHSTIWGMTISFFVLAFIGLFLAGTEFLRYPVDKKDMKQLLSFSVFLALARGLTAIASKLDVLMIVSLVGPSQAGIYALASRVSSIYSLFSGSFSTVVAPRVAAFTDKDELLQFMKLILLSTLGLIGTVFIPLIFAELFMTLLFADKGLLSAPVFRVLLIGQMFFVGSIPAVTLALYHLHKPYILTINSVLQLLTVVILNYFFIPKFGAIGAAYSLVIAYALSLALTSGMCWQYWREKHGNVSADHRPHGGKK